MNPKREIHPEKAHRSHSLCLPITIQLRTEAEGMRPHPGAKSILQEQPQPGSHQPAAEPECPPRCGRMRGAMAGCILQGAELFTGEVNEIIKESFRLLWRWISDSGRFSLLPSRMDQVRRGIPSDQGDEVQRPVRRLRFIFHPQRKKAS